MNWIALATVCGLPATAVPAGLTGQSLPVGVQIIGPRGDDSRTRLTLLGVVEFARLALNLVLEFGNG